MNNVILDSRVDPKVARPATRYRAVNPWAVASLAMGVLSALTFLSWWLAPLPLAAVFLGWRALVRIERATEELTGRELALAGIALAVVFWGAGYGWLWYAKASEAPPGYQTVDYADLQPDLNNPEAWLAKVNDLNDKKVYVKGYMAPSRQQIRLRRFILCPTNGACKFCNPNPTPTEMILVALTGDLTADYTTHLIGIGGKFHFDPKNPRGVPYSMEVDYLN